MRAATFNTRSFHTREPQSQERSQCLTSRLMMSLDSGHFSHSTSSQPEAADSLISSTTPTWSPRLEMVTRLSNGFSTTGLRPSNLSVRLGTHGTSRILDAQATCKSGELTVVGSRLSDTKMAPSSMRRENTLMLATLREKARTQSSPTEVARSNKSGRSSMSAQ